MKYDKHITQLEESISERFITRAKDAIKRLKSEGATDYGCYATKEMGATRRAAVDVGRVMTKVNQMKMFWVWLFLLIALNAGAQYHIRVECFYNPSADHNPEYQDYNIAFTNDNWKTKANIMETWDASWEEQPNNVIRQLMLFENGKQEAIFFAKKFTSYKMCISFNNAVNDKYLKLVSYRKSHPIFKPKPLAKKKYKCCTVTQIY